LEGQTVMRFRKYVNAVIIYTALSIGLLLPVIAQTNDIQTIVDSLDIEQFKSNIQTLASFGDRTQGSPSYVLAADWVAEQLEAVGYTVEEDFYIFLGGARSSLYATKIGTDFPDRMYIVSAHLDGRGNGGAADDDGSGSALVLEVARALAQPGVETATSVRFIFWNNEETGLNGSTAYVNERQDLQGIEDPPGSGRYPEPTWLGIIQHDMILFDHGFPVQNQQVSDADIDVEYQATSTFAQQSRTLAQALQNSNTTYSTDYPADIGDNMRNTDSVPFRNFTAAVSVRENTRDDIGRGANPHWHQPSDVYATYSEADFRLGFNAVQMTLGAVTELAGASLNQSGNTTVSGDVNCDNSVDSVDGLFILQFEVGLREAGESCEEMQMVEDTILYLPVCDVNRDSQCSALDALLIFQCDVGIENQQCTSPM